MWVFRRPSEVAFRWVRRDVYVDALLPDLASDVVVDLERDSASSCPVENEGRVPLVEDGLHQLPSAIYAVVVENRPLPLRDFTLRIRPVDETDRVTYANAGTW